MHFDFTFEVYDFIVITIKRDINMINIQTHL
jgi:hypothetical protein